MVTIHRLKYLRSTGKASARDLRKLKNMLRERRQAPLPVAQPTTQAFAPPVTSVPVFAPAPTAITAPLSPQDAATAIAKSRKQLLDAKERVSKMREKGASNRRIKKFKATTLAARKETFNNLVSGSQEQFDAKSFVRNLERQDKLREKRRDLNGQFSDIRADESRMQRALARGVSSDGYHSGPSPETGAAYRQALQNGGARRIAVHQKIAELNLRREALRQQADQIVTGTPLPSETQRLTELSGRLDAARKELTTAEPKQRLRLLGEINTLRTIVDDLRQRLGRPEQLKAQIAQLDQQRAALQRELDALGQ